MPIDHLAKLNSEQRRAVKHGVGLEHAAAPLLVIAGAGSGKTNTLAHRVANLILNGLDPRRILLMTFSRRAASEMGRQVESICTKVLGAKAGIMTDALTWAGTFHAVGARLLREYAEQIGLQPNFTIHDREDVADLMNLVRHQLGFSQTESRFPAKGTCLSIYSRAVNAEMPLEAVLQGHFPWCSAWETQLREHGEENDAPAAEDVLARDVLPLEGIVAAQGVIADADVERDVAKRLGCMKSSDFEEKGRFRGSRCPSDGSGAGEGLHVDARFNRVGVGAYAVCGLDEFLGLVVGKTGQIDVELRRDAEASRGPMPTVAVTVVPSGTLIFVWLEATRMAPRKQAE